MDEAPNADRWQARVPGAIVISAGGYLVMLASSWVWAVEDRGFRAIEIPGTDGYGRLTLVLGVVAVVSGALWLALGKGSTWPLWAPLVVAGAAVVVASVNLAAPTTRLPLQSTPEVTEVKRPGSGGGSNL